MNRLYFASVADDHKIGTLTPSEDPETARASGTFGEITLDAATGRWVVSITVAGRQVFYAIAMATAESAMALANDAVGREREAEIAGLVVSPTASP